MQFLLKKKKKYFKVIISKDNPLPHLNPNFPIFHRESDFFIFQQIYVEDNFQKILKKSKKLFFSPNT